MLPETRPSKVGKWTEPARRVLRERYLSRKDGEVTETPEEMCWRGATSIAAGGAGGGRPPGGGRGEAGGLFPKIVGGEGAPDTSPPIEDGEGRRGYVLACSG